MVGQTVGNYRITRLLGEGGMGAVYLAEHPGIGRKAAVKVLHPELSANPEIVRRFFNEARAANAIHHPGIVEVLDFGALPSGASYIVMEFLDGQTLAARLERRQQPSLGDAIGFVSQAAAALDAAHAKGIVHRDLKPENLFLVPDPRNAGREVVKVLDFGIAKLGAGQTGPGSRGTRTGTLLGTPTYMSPEQCLGTKEVDRRTDIYALGVILYEILCGTPPFVSEGQGELIHLQISAPPPPPRAKNPTIPLKLEAVVLKALAKDPAQRFQTMADLGRALHEIPLTAAASTPTELLAKAVPPRQEAHPSMTTLSGGASTIERMLTRPRRRMSMVLAGGVVLAAAAAYLVVSKSPEPPRAPVPAAVAPVVVPLTNPAPVPEHLEAIVVSVTSEPPGARVVRESDGEVLGLTPFRQSRRPDRGQERLRVELDGYQAESLTVPLDSSTNFVASLRPAAAAASPKKKPAARAPARRPPAAGPTLPTPPSAPPRAEPLPL